jgi:hypothetical protein
MIEKKEDFLKRIKKKPKTDESSYQNLAHFIITGKIPDNPKEKE